MSKQAPVIAKPPGKQSATASAQPRPPASATSPPIRRRWTVPLALGLGMALGGAAANFWAGGQAGRQYEADRLKSELALHDSQAELAQARLQLDAAQGQLMVEESTRKGLAASLQATQSELGQARDQLAFFDQLLPPGPAGSISIRALDIERQGPTLQYRVLLMRNGADDKPFKGYMQFVANGSRQGKAAKMELRTAQSPGSAAVSGDSPAPTGIGLDFDQFQRAGGLLSIPEGFTPQTITLNVMEEGGAVRVARTVNLYAAD